MFARRVQIVVQAFVCRGSFVRSGCWLDAERRRGGLTNGEAAGHWAAGGRVD